MKHGIVSLVLALSGQAFAAPEGVRGALEGTRLGFYAGGEFRLVEGRCADCATIPQALWYFRDDLVAVPLRAPAGFEPRLRVRDDVRTWLAANPAGDGAKPPLLWIGAPLLAEGALLAADGGSVTLGGRRVPFAVVPKIDSNLSYYDASSVKHFAGRALQLRGRMDGERFVARTLWPQDYALHPAQVPYQPLAAGETLESLVRADGGGARLPFAARVLWRRGADAQTWAGKAVLGVILNGAQGDDDEAHGGHFALATGRFGERGEWGELLVNNFYNLDSVSEKGIIAATLTMDAYMTDLNSGQAWYRPSYLLLAVLKSERAPRLYQEAVGRVYNHFYRHDFSYRHASANCTGISMETLRELGLGVPMRGPTSRAKAVVALPYMTVSEWSIDSGRSAYDYLTAESTMLYPFAGFVATGADLLERVAAGRGATTAYERMLGEDLEALIFVRFPQFPSSRAFGQAPVVSIDEYMKRVPENKAEWKIVPVGPRPFPAEMRDSQAPGDPWRASSYALWCYGSALVLLVAAAALWWRGRRKGAGSAA